MKTDPWEESEQSLAHYRKKSVTEMRLEYKEIMKLVL